MFDLQAAMTDLEESFTAWRWQMLAAGIKAPAPLEELELHLREEVEQQLRCDADPRQAFASAVERMGYPGDLEREFSKASGRGFQFWLLWLGIGCFGLVQTAMMNLVGPLVFHRHSSVLFSQKWWVNWFPSYIIWITFLLLGSAIGLARWRARRRTVGA
jgi:hypothetical protein